MSCPGDREDFFERESVSHLDKYQKQLLWEWHSNAINSDDVLLSLFRYFFWGMFFIIFISLFFLDAGTQSPKRFEENTFADLFLYTNMIAPIIIPIFVFLAIYKILKFIRQELNIRYLYEIDTPLEQFWWLLSVIGDGLFFGFLMFSAYRLYYFELSSKVGDGVKLGGVSWR